MAKLPDRIPQAPACDHSTANQKAVDSWAAQRAAEGPGVQNINTGA